MQKIDKFRYIKHILDVKFNNFDEELNKLTSNTNNLGNNDRSLTEWCKVTRESIESTSNTCEKIENKCEVKNDELANIPINHINDKLTTLKDHVLEIVDNTNVFAIHLAQNEGERQKLTNEIIAHIDQIHKNYETDLYIPRNSTPLTEEENPVKEILTPFLG
ncbi:hypothetical protein O181_031494 [Austropuccinia psidii MF-1]|uniref:Uncharacterized protein n=1 Tax=Austropuccinia psidii MF-1 TaxID=1389203 RepID=A0A9Q3CVU4_9BASI|nr:hypothetical protein [Austropuccinia psidii MF-1]